MFLGKKSINKKIEHIKKQKEIKNFSGEIIDFLKDLIIIIVVVLIVRIFFVMPFQINGQSMYESYYDKEFIIVDRFSYRVSSPERGDVIVFKPWVNKNKEYFLKRIIGISGDKIKIEAGKVFRQQPTDKDYKELDEKYLNKINKWFTYVSGNKELKEYLVPKGKYFVMWDNRNHATDSRQCFSSCSIQWSTQFITLKNLTWRVLIDLWYFNFKNFSFTHPYLSINTKPKFLSSPNSYEY